jgi:hypothetical protein
MEKNSWIGVKNGWMVRWSVQVQFSDNHGYASELGI